MAGVEKRSAGQPVTIDEEAEQVFALGLGWCHGFTNPYIAVSSWDGSIRSSYVSLIRDTGTAIPVRRYVSLKNDIVVV